MALERPYRGVPVDLREAYELRNRILLLGAVDCRHLVSAPCIVYPI